MKYITNKKSWIEIGMALVCLGGVAGIASAQSPAISSQPSSVTVASGATAQFSVGATGSGPLAYLWYFNNSPLSNIILTAAGGHIINNISATNALLLDPCGLAKDQAGNIYVADTFNHMVRKITTNGVIQVIGGNGLPGYTGDGGNATNAELNFPTSVAVDTVGNVYIADAANNRIRMVGTNGIITTAAGNGTIGFSGDGQAAVGASFNIPIGITIDANNNLYIADALNSRIRKVSGGTISTVAGSATAGYYGDGGLATAAWLGIPSGVSVDGSGNLYIVDYGNSAIRKVDGSGIISTVAGNGTAGYTGDGGSATLAELNYPWWVSADASGNLYIADTGNSVVRKVDASGVISTFAGNGIFGFTGNGGSATNAELSYPFGVLTDASGNVLIADFQNNCIRKVNSGGIISIFAGCGGAYYAGDGGAASVATFQYPEGIAVDVTGNVYIADSDNNRIREIKTNGTIVTVAGNGDQNYYGDGGAATNAALNTPFDVAIDAQGDILIADMANSAIRCVAPNGIITTVAGNGDYGYAGDGGAATAANLSFPTGLALDQSGNLFIADSYNGCVREVNTNGIISTVAGNGTNGYAGDGGLAVNAELNTPNSVTVDAVGNLYIADSFNHLVRKVNSAGTISTIAGYITNGVSTNGYFGDGGPAAQAALNFPLKVALGAAGEIYIADGGNSCIRVIATNSVITTFAGNGTVGYAGDNGPAAQAVLNSPSSIAFDSLGNAYISDTGNNRIRQILLNGSPKLLINNATVANQGNYFVTVANSSGSVTSSVVQLTISGAVQGRLVQSGLTGVILASAQPKLRSAQRTGQVFVVSYAVKPNATYQLQYTSDLFSGVWVNTGNIVSASQSSLTLTDAANSSQRFYRLKLVKP